MTPKLSKPPEWLVTPPKTNRNLEYDNENYESYLVDSNGNEYEPYSLAWRYLGMYIDCDVAQEEAETTMDETNIYRKLSSRRKLFRGEPATTTPAFQRGLGSGDENDGDDCSRKVLWAAYHDPGYRGNSIGEYQFYNHQLGTWDTSTCQTGRCAKMDCHASNSRFQLIGVFKEADGLTDWAEQLFKHEGYCIWDGDKQDDDDDDDEHSGDNDENNNDDDSYNSSSDYEFMSNRQNYMSQSCYQMYLTDDDGNTVYRGIRPLPGGHITDALYTDEDCTERSTMSFGDYIVKWYTNFYYDEDQGKEIAEQWSEHTNRWNKLMMDYHVCQPCRAYNKVPVWESDNENNDQHNNNNRLLDQNDGGGDEEQWGYNCYDDAGYRNCNQCYKFETKTDMEPASIQDLERASNQGSILAIKVDGVTYGRGGIDWHDVEANLTATLWTLGVLAALGGICLLGYRKFKRPLRRFWHRLQSRKFQKTLRQAFVDDDGLVTVNSLDDEETSSWSVQMKEELVRNRRLVEEQRREIERIQSELMQEKSMRAMEREMGDKAFEIVDRIEHETPRGKTVDAETTRHGSDVDYTSTNTNTSTAPPESNGDDESTK